jgi:transposase
MAPSPSPLPGSLPDASCLTLDEIVCQDGIMMMIVSAANGGSCPHCGVQAWHIHSRYCRTLRELPCHGTVVRICLRTHRFYCRVRDCRCRIFTQRLPTVTSPLWSTNLSASQRVTSHRVRVGWGSRLSLGSPVGNLRERRHNSASHQPSCIL